MNRRVILFMLSFAMLVSISACGSDKTKPSEDGMTSELDSIAPSDDPVIEDNAPKDEDNDALGQTDEIDEADDVGETDDANDSGDNTAILMSGDWTIQEIDSDELNSLVDGFVNAWNSGKWSMPGSCEVGDEILKDVVFFRNMKEGEHYFEYYCLVNAEFHLKEKYKNDGSTYFSFSDSADDELVNVYVIDALSKDSLSFHFDLNGFFTDVESALDCLRGFCGDDLLAVTSEEKRLEIIEQTANNKEASDTYDAMEDFLKKLDFESAQQLYYKTTGLTYKQSRDCLILLTKYELLLSEINPVISAYASGASGGKYSLKQYVLNSWQDEGFPEDENCLVIYIEYTLKTTHPILGNQTHSDKLTIPITLDVDNKSFTKRG